MINNLAYGSDAEVFLQTLGGEPFPSCGIIGGTKTKPRNIGAGFYIQEDNVLLEFNIPVCSTIESWRNAFAKGLTKIGKEVPPSLLLAYYSSTSFPEAYIRGIAQAQEFGCEPDYNAWTQEQNPKPKAADPNFRSAAAHVHLSWDSPDPEDQINVIKWADVFVSLPSVWESHDKERRQLYGKAGAFRPKVYGVEHRVLDNYWIWNSDYVGAIYKRYAQAVKAVNNNLNFFSGDEERIVDAINNYKIEEAKILCSKYRELLASPANKE